MGFFDLPRAPHTPGYLLRCYLLPATSYLLPAPCYLLTCSVPLLPRPLPHPRRVLRPRRRQVRRHLGDLVAQLQVRSATRPGWPPRPGPRPAGCRRWRRCCRCRRRGSRPGSRRGGSRPGKPERAVDGDGQGLLADPALAQRLHLLGGGLAPAAARSTARRTAARHSALLGAAASRARPRSTASASGTPPGQAGDHGGQGAGGQVAAGVAVGDGRQLAAQVERPRRGRGRAGPPAPRA